MPIDVIPVDPVPGGRILVVDDDVLVGMLLEQILTTAGHSVTVRRNGMEALDAIAQSPPDLILLDLDMPSLGGFEVCEQVKRNPATRFTPVVIITGRDPPAARLQSWELGADEFLSKPFQAIEVLTRCRSLLRVKRLTDELDSAQAVIFAFARTVEAKSPYTFGHSERATNHAVRLAVRAGLSEAEVAVLRSGGLLHDIGKIGTPDAILNKPGPLSREEYEIVQQHPMQGVRIVEPLQSLRNTIPMIRWHHERCDGRGYPDGLTAKDIPRSVRILAVADVYDAVSSARPYRPAIPGRKCLELLRENAANGGLDPDLAELFVEDIAEVVDDRSRANAVLAK
jgi:putative two-component system response regulator